jgi:hypothetical protein
MCQLLNTRHYFYHLDTSAVGFIAVHLRRGHTTLPPLSLRTVGGIIKTLMQAHKSRRLAIFIASNKPDPHDLAQLRKLTGALVVRFEGEASALPEHLISTVEMAICSYANFFVPSPESTWSHGVKLMAVANGAQVMMAKDYNIFKWPKSDSESTTGTGTGTTPPSGNSNIDFM